MLGFLKKVWNFLDGKKSMIMAVVGTTEILLKSHGVIGPIGVIDTMAKVAGWDQVAPAVDPGQLALIAGTLIAMGHKVIKSQNGDGK